MSEVSTKIKMLIIDILVIGDRNYKGDIVLLYYS